MKWDVLCSELLEQGFAVSDGAVWTPEQCADLRSLYADETRFRKRIQMERFRFGAGDYQYFAHPLPDCVVALRHEAYAALAPVANEWMARLSNPIRYPAMLPEFLAICQEAGQVRPTPLLLHYESGGFNCLH